MYNKGRDKMKKVKTKRIRNLILIPSFSVVVLLVATYAWFIGLQSVNITSFDVEIAASESLLLSLDGENWNDSVAISKNNLDEVSYLGHKNSWGGTGLIPMSSIGELNSTSSKMKLYEKASLTSTPGGFRLMASLVPNTVNEQNGYVAFDLFIKNFSGTQYIEELNVLTEEAIYLTTDSAVTVSSSGTAGTGIENSVRVGFAQIGRVEGTTDVVETITGIVCVPEAESNVTGICRNAQIWEPNDTTHEANAISWYNTICKTRTGEDVTLPASYSGTCEELSETEYIKTYAVNDIITHEDNVDVYDGLEFNSYTNSSLLSSIDTFTDTMKNIAGVSRPQFMSLQPNSITKLRIYIWIEGQDIDNYDYAALGRAISINFGFTKQRITEDDFNYESPTP